MRSRHNTFLVTFIILFHTLNTCTFFTVFSPLWLIYITFFWDLYGISKKQGSFEKHWYVYTTFLWELTTTDLTNTASICTRQIQWGQQLMIVDLKAHNLLLSIKQAGLAWCIENKYYLTISEKWSSVTHTHIWSYMRLHTRLYALTTPRVININFFINHNYYKK